MAKDAGSDSDALTDTRKKMSNSGMITLKNKEVIENLSKEKKEKEDKLREETKVEVIRRKVINQIEVTPDGESPTSQSR